MVPSMARTPAVSELQTDIWKGLLPLVILYNTFQAQPLKWADERTSCVVSVLWEGFENRSKIVCLQHTRIISCSKFANLLLVFHEYCTYRWICCILIHSQRPVASDGLRDHLFHEFRCVNKNYRKKPR